MSHPRWPGYDTKSGDPVADNSARRANKYIYKSTIQHLKFTGYKNRKRKRQLLRIEGGHYIQLWVSVYNEIARGRGVQQ